MAIDVFGVLLIVIGLALFAFELAHPGALLLIPGSVLVMAGLLYTFFPSTLLSTPYGAIAIILAAIVGALVQLPYYKYVAPNHRPMASTASGFAGESGVVVSPIVPNTLSGKVRVRTEVWSARADVPIPAGTRVKILSGEGVSLKVTPADDAAPS
jgi:inner membrane protein